MNPSAPAVEGTGEAARGRSRHAPPTVRAQLGDARVTELVDASMAGAKREELVNQYGVSLSSVKQMQDAEQATRAEAPEHQDGAEEVDHA